MPTKPTLSEEIEATVTDGEKVGGKFLAEEVEQASAVLDSFIDLATPGEYTDTVYVPRECVTIEQLVKGRLARQNKTESELNLRRTEHRIRTFLKDRANDDSVAVGDSMQDRVVPLVWGDSVPKAPWIYKDIPQIRFIGVEEFDYTIQAAKPAGWSQVTAVAVYFDASQQSDNKERGAWWVPDQVTGELLNKPNRYWSSHYKAIVKMYPTDEAAVEDARNLRRALASLSKQDDPFNEDPFRSHDFTDGGADDDRGI